MARLASLTAPVRLSDGPVCLGDGPVSLGDGPVSLGGVPFASVTVPFASVTARFASVTVLFASRTSAGRNREFRLPSAFPKGHWDEGGIELTERGLGPYAGVM